MSPTTFCFSLLLLLITISFSNASYTRTYTPMTSYYKPPVSKYVPSTQPMSGDIYQYLKGHNSARVAVGLAPLAWDNKLASYAQWWANQRRGDCSLKHSGGPYGENIFWGSSGGYSGAFAVQSWVVEKRFYNYYTNSCGYGEDCGHYTQIVWKNTKRVGCAKAVCYGGQGTFITCNYDPAGNYIGTRPY